MALGWVDQKVVQNLLTRWLWADQKLVHNILTRWLWADQKVAQNILTRWLWADQKIVQNLVARWLWSDQKEVQNILTRWLWADQKIEGRRTFLKSANSDSASRKKARATSFNSHTHSEYATKQNRVNSSFMSFVSHYIQTLHKLTCIEMFSLYTYKCDVSV